MDRRSFVRKAGLIAAGSAFGGSSVGCAATEGYAYVPCLAKVDAPTPVAGMTYIRASHMGCALDCDLTTGLNIHTGGAATDDALLINAALAGATANNPITLIVDGGALISGLFLPAGGYWSIAGLGCGTGFFIKSGANNDGIHNGNATANVPADPGPNAPLPPRGSSVSLSNFTINGNQGNGRNGDSTTGIPQGAAAAWYICINLMNLNNITVTNVVVVNSPSYHFRFSNCGNITVSGCVMRSSGLNTDGLHFNGPANNISISNCDFTMGDDAIALNCPEGYSGNISQVTVSNCTFNSSTLMRLYTIHGNNNPYKFVIDGVTVSNCTGSLFTAGFLIGQAIGSAPNSVASLSISNCTLTAPALLDVSANFGAVVLTGVTLVPAAVFQDVGYAFLRTSGYFSSLTYAGTSLSFNQCILQRTGNYPVAAVIVSYGSTIGDVEFNGFAVQDPAGSSYTAAPQLVNIQSGSIGQVVIDTVDTTHITALASAGGFSSIASVSGAGVLATAWQFPDAVMANATPYISASSGQASIKAGGLVEPYP